MQAISCEACIRAGEDCKVNYNYKAVCLRCADKKVHCTIGPQPAKPGKNFRSDKKGIREKAKLWHDTVLAAIKFNATNPPESKISYPLYPVIEEDEDQPEEESRDELYCVLKTNIVGVQYYKGASGEIHGWLYADPESRFSGYWRAGSPRTRAAQQV